LHQLLNLNRPSRLRNLMTSSEFLTDLQLAARWHLHRQTLIRWRSSNTGPAFTKINGYTSESGKVADYLIRAATATESV
jgi:hypothetical protein